MGRSIYVIACFAWLLPGDARNNRRMARAGRFSNPMIHLFTPAAWKKVAGGKRFARHPRIANPN